MTERAAAPPPPSLDHLRVLATTCEDCQALLAWIESASSETGRTFADGLEAAAELADKPPFSGTDLSRRIRALKNADAVPQEREAGVRNERGQALAPSDAQGHAPAESAPQPKGCESSEETQPNGAVPCVVGAPDEYRVFKDGDAWCATGGGFVNLAESDAGFGHTPLVALGELIVQERK